MVTAPVAPRIDYEEDEDNKTQDQQNNRAWLVFPEEVEASGELI